MRSQSCGTDLSLQAAHQSENGPHGKPRPRVVRRVSPCGYLDRLTLMEYGLTNQIFN